MTLTAKSSLICKLDLLAKLDNELIKLVYKGELDKEVEQASIIRERIGLCIIDIDPALSHASMGTSPQQPVNEDFQSVNTETSSSE